MPRRRVWTALAVAVGSGAGSVLLRRHRQRHTNRIDLYFDDGSMLSLATGAPDADRLLPIARDLLAEAG